MLVTDDSCCNSNCQRCRTELVVILTNCPRPVPDNLQTFDVRIHAIAIFCAHIVCKRGTQSEQNLMSKELTDSVHIKFGYLMRTIIMIMCSQR